MSIYLVLAVDLVERSAQKSDKIAVMGNQRISSDALEFLADSLRYSTTASPDELLRLMRMRPVFVINGVPMRRIKIEIKSHPKARLEDLPTRRDAGLHEVVIARMNGRITGSYFSHSISHRKSRRVLIEYDWRDTPSVT